MRGRGTGVYADAIEAVFDATVKRLGFNETHRHHEPHSFQRPVKPTAQLSLF